MLVISHQRDTMTLTLFLLLPKDMACTPSLSFWPGWEPPHWPDPRRAWPQSDHCGESSWPVRVTRAGFW